MRAFFVKKIEGIFCQKLIFFRLKKNKGLVFQNGKDFILFNWLSLKITLTYSAKKKKLFYFIFKKYLQKIMAKQY